MAESASGRRRGGIDGTSSGRPWAMSNSELAPSWTSWAAMAAPWACTRSARLGQPGQEAVVADGGLAGRVGARRVGHRRRTDQDQAGAASGPGLQVGGLAVAHGAVVVGQAVTHRGHHDAVAQRHGADAAGGQQVGGSRSQAGPTGRDPASRVVAPGRDPFVARRGRFTG